MNQSRHTVQAAPFEEIRLEKAENRTIDECHAAILLLPSARHFVIGISVVLADDVGNAVVGKVLKSQIRA